MKYVKVDDLQAYCDNQIDHSITPNDFQRMNHLDVVRCKDCKHYNVDYCRITDWERPPEWFCADGRKEGNEVG